MGKCAALLRPLSLKKARMPPIELCLCCDRIIKGLPWARPGNWERYSYATALLFQL